MIIGCMWSYIQLRAPCFSASWVTTLRVCVSVPQWAGGSSPVVSSLVAPACFHHPKGVASNCFLELVFLLCWCVRIYTGTTLCPFLPHSLLCWNRTPDVWTTQKWNPFQPLFLVYFKADSWLVCHVVYCFKAVKIPLLDINPPLSLWWSCISWWGLEPPEIWVWDNVNLLGWDPGLCKQGRMSWAQGLLVPASWLCISCGLLS